jgi:hypothetical protein
MKIRPVGAELFHADGRTDGHDETKSFFVILRTRLQTKILNLVGNKCNVILFQKIWKCLKYDPPE